MKYNIHIGDNNLLQLESVLAEIYNERRIFILVDTTTRRHCLPLLLKHIPRLSQATLITIKPGEQHKQLSTVEYIWMQLTQNHADRQSLLINLGGGVVCDLGGFAASSYMRGIDFINVPTTLLAQVDAAIGGKTGFDFMGFKNQIGSFALPVGTYIFPIFLHTLDKRQLRSGFAEVIKHALISDKIYWRLINKAISEWNVKTRQCLVSDIKNWEQIILRSVQIKSAITGRDPKESGERKKLNYGHTIGHAIESYFLSKNKPILHGEAIAIGMICEAFISVKKSGLLKKELEEITKFIFSVFPTKIIPESSFPELLELMRHDKKNSNSKVLFTLLCEIGKALVNRPCDEKTIIDSIEYYNFITFVY